MECEKQASSQVRQDLEDVQHLRIVYEELVDEDEIRHIAKLIPNWVHTPQLVAGRVQFGIEEIPVAKRHGRNRHYTMGCDFWHAQEPLPPFLINNVSALEGGS